MMSLPSKHATITPYSGLGMAGFGEPNMSVARSAIKKQPVDRNTSMLQTFVWEGADKRGVKMKGSRQPATPICCEQSCAVRALCPAW